jgi:YD repeat-containing protein
VARSYQYPSWTNANGQLNSQRFKLTRVVAENGNPVVNVAYDTLGRATASWVGSHNVSLTQVNYGAGSATVTDQLGVSTAMAFTSFDNSRRFYVSATSHNCDGGCAGGDAFEYDSRGNLSGITTKLGVKTCIAYTTPRNLPVLVVEGLPSGASCSDALASPPSDARVRTYQWHASYAVPMTVTGPQMKTLFSYDTAGRVLLRAEVDTNDFTGAAGANAQSTGNSRTTTWTYDAKGSVASLKSSRSDVSATTTYTYDTAENLTSATDPVGLVTTFGGYDANGRPGLVTYPNGLQTSLAYDARGRVTQVTTGGAATTYSYDAAGLLVSSTLPSGISLSMGYDDANRLILTQDSLGNRVDRVLDAAGNVVQETVKGNGGAVALSSQAAYDQLSRITSLTKAF